MKDYLKSYINSLNDDTITEIETPIAKVETLPKRRDSIREETDPFLKMKHVEINNDSLSENKNIVEKRENKKKRIAIKDSPEWDIYKERVFIKTLLHQRFNYFVIVYTLIILSAAIVQVKISQAIILVTGFFILSMLWFNLVRVYIEFQEIYELFHKTVNSNIVLNIIEKRTQARQSFFSKLPMNSALAYGIPTLCLVSVLCYIIILLIIN